jgi:pimeloyl-ACP methyl ester carboxylesterase
MAAAKDKKMREGGRALKWGAGAAAGAVLVAIVANRGAARRQVPAGVGASADTRRPSWARLLGEGPAAARLLVSQLGPVPLREPDLGGGRAVLVIPGLLTNDAPTFLLRRTLKACGFRAYGWAQGLNLGVRTNLFGRLEERLDQVLRNVGGPVALVGWSLGGLYARELAKRRPKDVSIVITLGSPFSVHLRDNNAWKLYEAINDHRVDDAPVPMDVSAKPPVHTVAIWSARDGLVAPASASGKAVESDEQLRIDTKHQELVSHPKVLETLVHRLAQA